MDCVKRESDPQLNLGRVTCYHYTIDALFCLVPTCWNRTSYPLITKVYFLPLQSNALPNELKSVPIIIGVVSLSIFIC